MEKPRCLRRSLKRGPIGSETSFGQNPIKVSTLRRNRRLSVNGLSPSSRHLKQMYRVFLRPVFGLNSDLVSFYGSSRLLLPDCEGMEVLQLGDTVASETLDYGGI